MLCITNFFYCIINNRIVNMKLFFLATVAAESDFKNDFKKIISIFEEQNQDVIYQHSFESAIELESLDLNALEIRAKSLVKKMLTSDGVIFEGTLPSTGSGYFLSIALQKKIPVLFLHQKKNYSGLYLADQNRLLVMKKYSPSNKMNLIKIAKNFIQFAQKKRLTNRFNLMISDSMGDFISSSAAESNISKADFIRNLVYSKMEEK